MKKQTKLEILGISAIYVLVFLLFMVAVVNGCNAQSYQHAVPSINKDTLYLKKGDMQNVFISVWDEYEKCPIIFICDSIDEHRKRYLDNILAYKKESLYLLNELQ